MALKLTKGVVKLKEGTQKDEKRSMQSLLLFSVKTFAIALGLFMALMAF